MQYTKLLFMSEVENPFAGMAHGTRTQTSEPNPEPTPEPEEEKPVEEPEAAEQPETEAPAEEPKAEEADAGEEPKEKEEVEDDGVVTLDFGQKEEQKETSTETIEAYKERLKTLETELEKAKETPKLDPRIQKLNEIVLNGGDINQSVWEMQTKEYDKVDITDSKSAMSIVEDKLKYIDGDDNDLIGFYFEQHFPVLSGKKGEDDFDTDEDFSSAKRREEMLLRKDAKQFVPKLKEFQDGMRLPSSPKHNQQEEYEQAIKAYRSEAITKVNEINSFDLSLADDLNVRIPITGEAAEYANSIATEPENQAQFFNQRYVTEDGTVNHQKLKVEMYRLQNQTQIDKALFDQGRSYGKKEALKELQGENAGSPKKPAPKSGKVKNPFAGMAYSTR